MKVIIDRDKLQRRARFSHAASLGGMLAILVSVALPLWRASLTTISTVLLVAGFVVATVGIYFANRWVKRPRPEDTIDQALKGSSDTWRMYHYAFAAEHLLATPNGLIAIDSCTLEGAFTYKEGRWRQKLTPGRAMRFFVEESFGNPIERALGQARTVQTWLESKLADGTRVPVQAMVVFVHPAARLEVQGSPIPVVTPDRLRKRIPQDMPKLPDEVFARVRVILDQAAGI